MAQHARVEEVEDSDPEDMDPTDFEPSKSGPVANQSILNPASIPSRAGPTAAERTQRKERVKHWQCLYPVYFDKSRSRHEGRRVSKDLAVENPLAREILDAVMSMGLNFDFEPEKIHPKDWANPGRVRCLVKENERPVSKGVQNKHHLYIKVAEWLKDHPTTQDSPLRLKIAGMGPQNEPPPPPAVPRGWKMNSVVPLHSAAASGGGVSENLFKDMMAEMQGQEGGTAGPSGSGASKKDKKKGNK